MDVRINGSVQIPGQPMDSGIVQLGRRSKWVWVNEFLPVGQRVTITDEGLNATPQVGAELVERAREGHHELDRQHQALGPDMPFGNSGAFRDTALRQVRDLLAAVTTAPSPDAALDEATQRAAVAWGVPAKYVELRMLASGRYRASIHEVRGVVAALEADTRLAALEALAAPRVKPVEEMTGKELIDEIRQRTGDVAATGMIALRQTVTALRAQVKD